MSKCSCHFQRKALVEGPPKETLSHLPHLPCGHFPSCWSELNFCQDQQCTVVVNTAKCTCQLSCVQVYITGPILLYPSLSNEGTAFYHNLWLWRVDSSKMWCIHVCMLQGSLLYRLMMYTCMYMYLNSSIATSASLPCMLPTNHVCLVLIMYVYIVSWERAHHPATLSLTLSLSLTAMPAMQECWSFVTVPLFLWWEHVLLPRQLETFSGI